MSYPKEVVEEALRVAAGKLKPMLQQGTCGMCEEEDRGIVSTWANPSGHHMPFVMCTHCFKRVFEILGK